LLKAKKSAPKWSALKVPTPWGVHIGPVTGLWVIRYRPSVRDPTQRYDDAWSAPYDQDKRRRDG
jgi:hypothetical protein